ncbi:MAG: hypothetical protein IJS47_03270 [Clostridia bacterium]|nr:hypothetical protein [Clostridia bacterium]
MYYNNKRLALSIFWVVLGALLIGLSIAEILDSSVYSGMGGALVAVGFIRLIQIIRYRKDENYREKIDVQVKDERNKFLHLQSWAWTGYIIVLVEGIGAVVALVLGQETVQMVLAYSVCAIILVYWITYMILSRKY